ncbi:MAG: DUF3833 domain-containing protein [Alphaproteobacteria bacterium GM7ARS4]|nr:DUF3833 domain-containing protein [Alphaproteobacteria bacterium GM7ARS4]
MKRGIIMSSCAFLSACAGGIQGADYATLQPSFVLEDFFQGNIKAWGIVQDRSGRVVTRFDAELVGTWEGKKGVLREVFHYYDGPKKQYRTWHITKHDDMRYTGVAGDIVGQAQGTAHGNAIHWTYVMDVPVDESVYRLTFDDWMWAMRDGVVINRSYLKKFGITFAELTLFMQKQ